MIAQINIPAASSALSSTSHSIFPENFKIDRPVCKQKQFEYNWPKIEAKIGSRIEANSNVVYSSYDCTYNVNSKNLCKTTLVKLKKKVMSDLQKNLLKSKLPPMVPRSAKNMQSRHKDYSPLEWSEFFHDFVDVKIDNNSLRCYRTKPAESNDAPVLVLLHGGGYNGLSWAVFSVSLILLMFLIFQ